MICLLCLRSFRVPGIYTALKPGCCHLAQRQVLEYLEFTQLSNRERRELDADWF